MKLETSPERQQQIRAMSELLRTLSVGNIFSYSTLTASLGMDTQLGAGRYVLDRAIALAEIHKDAFFSKVRSEGVKRISTAFAPDIAGASRRKAGRAAGRGLKRTNKIRLNFSQTEAVRLEAERTVLREQKRLGRESSVRTEVQKITIASSKVESGSLIRT